ncbi:uncharacterized protein LACBIDRAFT_294476 [Laccaria bicolor S238N-H82]|uniref:Predicted protein n=1 Tax=Laccaria bicolor (strain S238N-H82 / ATCC MYA-4686) TaxID=486041 RepID=B0DCB2_LACBS|nr:uncharacterized protein LACBIDRAFT_294476 [Laccaria bicolor S238N-H82]EDR07868.1 predicted protein [Laccaria bicolor S238N-H82]|eukprot:XP_001881657.1 predicted protein [Laccaria bicolor S238N-H82]
MSQDSEAPTKNGVGEATPPFVSTIPELKSWSDSESDLESDSGDDAGVNAEAGAPVQQKSVTVLLMGQTGTGKSSFIRLLTGNKDVKIGKSIEPETSDISTFDYAQNDGLEVSLVDTPGFDDNRAHMSDSKLLQDLIEFLLKRRNAKTVNGLIYLHRISDVRFGGTATRNLRMFSRLCGPDAMKNVVILTTRWDETRRDVAEKTEADLTNSHFKEFVNNGAKVLRHDNTVASARNVISSIMDLPPIGEIKVVNEIVGGRSLAETDAGRELDSQLTQLKTQHVEDINGLREQYKAARLAQDEEQQAEIKRLRDELLAKLEKVDKDKKNLEGMKQWTFASHGAQIGLNIPFVPSVIGTMVGGAVGAVADHRAKKKQQAKLRRTESQRAAAGGAGVVDEAEKETVEVEVEQLEDLTFKEQGARIGKNIPFVPSVIGSLAGEALGTVADYRKGTKDRAKAKRESGQTTDPVAWFKGKLPL